MSCDKERRYGNFCRISLKETVSMSQYVYDCKKLASLPAILNLSGILLWPVEAATDLAKQTHVTGVFSLSRAARPSTWLAPATQNQ